MEEEPNALKRAFLWYIWHSLLGMCPLIIALTYIPSPPLHAPLYQSLIDEGIGSFFAAVVSGVVWIEFTFSHIISRNRLLLTGLALFPLLFLTFGIIAICALQKGSPLDDTHGPCQVIIFIAAGAYSVTGKLFLFDEEIGTQLDLIECEKSKDAQ